MASCVIWRQELSQLMKVVVADANDMADILFYGQLRDQQHSQITDSVDRFHYHGADGEGVVVNSKTTKHRW